MDSLKAVRFLRMLFTAIKSSLRLFNNSKMFRHNYAQAVVLAAKDSGLSNLKTIFSCLILSQHFLDFQQL